MKQFRPLATYRIQFNKDFNFSALEKIIPYLKSLGVETIYASPIFQASPASMHGYDVTDPLKINSEIGTEKQLLALSAKLRKEGIHWVQDIVPNHMAFHPDNHWLMDVLEKGKKSAFFSYFDISPAAKEKLMVPFLGEELQEAIVKGSIKLTQAGKVFILSFGGNDWPINSQGQSYVREHTVAKINRDKALMRNLIDSQYYLPCYWQKTEKAINYRRFFTVNSLICLNIQSPQTFNAYHEYIFKLIDKGVFQGLRVDHVDGLADPKAYLRKLRKSVGPEAYIVVEKILAHNEQLPVDWGVEGTTGYDFLAISNNLFTNKMAQKPFDEIYKQVTGKIPDPAALAYQKKKDILYGHIQGELDNLVSLFIRSELTEKEDLDRIGETSLKNALGELLIRMPVYRYYAYDFPLSGTALDNLTALFDQVTGIPENHNAGKLLKQVFLEEPLKRDKNYRIKLGKFYQRCMQFTGPLMAKGVEDTLMFSYNRFAGHNEVGDSPESFGLQVDSFHQYMTERQLHWPFSMNAGATHDTKKGEDTRARLNVLTDIPGRWETLVRELLKLAAALQQKTPAYRDLHPNDIYLLFQTIAGMLALPGQEEDELEPRLSAYLEKALREAKKRSDWAEPDEQYESKFKRFAGHFTGPGAKGYQLFRSFVNEIADFAVINSLSQLLLKFTCPGIPDIYQGTELWDLSLVDPDNRRAVDYLKRSAVLADMENFPPRKLWEDRYSGRIKLWLTAKLLKIRKENQLIFESGEYIPLDVRGKYHKHICAYARKKDKEWILVAIPLGLASLCRTDGYGNFDWGDTEIILPQHAPPCWKDLLMDDIGAKDILRAGIRIDQLFTLLPIAVVLLEQKVQERAAGILMHITSLPSAFGIGDLGSEAYRFIDLLSAGKQKYWQILPLNPTKDQNGHSPYSGISAMAGNTLLISPELLLQEGLVRPDLKKARLPLDHHVDFKAVEHLKARLLKEAYQNFSKNPGDDLHQAYIAFCKNETGWLDDFALYTVIKQHHHGLEWYKWPEGLKRREVSVIQAFTEKVSGKIREVKWQQFIFYRQWAQLKSYASEKGISFIGDLPFYLDLDAVDVWCHPECFELNDNFMPEKVAGVPPDYFNEKGQRWGMPVYDWKAMKTEGYSWWINRLKKNMELFDLLRLDHFRAFYAYWEIPAADQDASGGKWVKAHGNHFFKTLGAALGHLPFVAEDLGEASAGVEALRQAFNLPGTKVLQFAFDEDLLASPHIPHNFTDANCVAYSGTHDNNTLKGWFENELGPEGKKRLSLYSGQNITAENVHQVLARLVYASMAKIAILPVQDILGLDENARINIPGQAQGNWTWRIGADDLDEAAVQDLKMLTEIFGRGN